MKHKTDYILKTELYFDGKVMQRPQLTYLKRLKDVFRQSVNDGMFYLLWHQPFHN